jgi:hypothetical protein
MNTVSRIREVHIETVWERGKGKGEKGKAVPHGSDD